MQTLLTILSLTVVLLTAGCSTVEGVGKDLKTLGNKIEKEAGQ